MQEKPLDTTNAGFVRHWKKIGPRLAEVEKQALRDYQHGDHLALNQAKLD